MSPRMIMNKVSSIMKYIICILGFLIFTRAGCALAGGKYNTQARVLSSIIYSDLIAHSVCVDADDCRDKEIFYGDHDEGVVFNFYGISESDAVLPIIGSARDFAKSEGVPVVLSFYIETKRDLLGLKRLVVKPRIKVEINK